MKVKNLKPLRYGALFIPANTIGEVLDSKDNAVFALIAYDYYVSFNGQEPFGVFKKEVEIVNE